ncbi:non-ribosomal peptide synthetase [Methylovirgula sp. 4M-Z18]|uniref:non-ribosomal peptide synthetase n=1 Tax=Methylovirgula sp. 4M-Z18 TaxID=2293567 RepID=UPI000E2FA760|nr:non-ribosomal peptide synthetase [Methylovirgula sp. 4M-Z18]RFB75520.1 amino acid adenylation domain-containing protein [Methylovirgula sp. 4M-Z18]
MGHTIASLFSHATDVAPDAPALISGRDVLSYRELDSVSRSLAAAMRRRGVRPGDRVLLIMERAPEAVVSMLAALLCGAVYVPLDKALPAEQIRAIIADCAPRLIVAAEGSAQIVSGTISYNDLLREGADDRADPSPSPGHADAAAYIMYTSGSTGQPKGVVVPHRGIIRLVIGCDYADLGPNETILQFAPLAFDASTLEIWGALLNGGRLVFVPGDNPSLDDIADVIAEHRVTTLWLTAGLFHVMIDQRLDALKPLRQLLAGGDVLSPSHVQRALRQLPGCRLINGYGPTENTTFTCCYTIPADYVGGPVPIGTPINGTSVHILDDQLQPVPDGELGQLCTGGAGVALGYLNRPDLTAEKFVSPPHMPGERLYLTGDLARRRADGVIEFAGRIDRQVKINGKRIELDAIEAALQNTANVRDGVAIVLQDGSGAKSIAAYVTLLNPQADGVAQIRAALQRHLPTYMVPSHITVLDALPLTANGKVDRKHLPDPRAAASQPIRLAAAPGNALEQDITRVWRRILARDHIDRDDNFFDLGATSLQVMAAHAEIARLPGVSVQLTDLFAHSNVAALTRHLTALNSAGPVVREDAAVRARRGQEAAARMRAARMRGVS